MAVLRLHCCAGFSLVAASREYSVVSVHRLLTAVASLGEHGPLGHVDFSSCATRAQVVVVPMLWNTGSIVVCGVSCFQACEIFWDMGSNPCFLHREADSLALSHQGSSMMVFRCNFSVYSTNSIAQTFLASKNDTKIKINWFYFNIIYIYTHTMYYIMNNYISYIHIYKYIYTLQIQSTWSYFQKLLREICALFIAVPVSNRNYIIKLNNFSAYYNKKGHFAKLWHITYFITLTFMLYFLYLDIGLHVSVFYVQNIWDQYSLSFYFTLVSSYAH